MRPKAKISERDRINRVNNLYVPAIGSYATESEMMPLFEQLAEFLFVETEGKKIYNS
jgi:hypothetical protein